ncbi:hypothetical protein PT286_04295 [Neisseriaceae bacterium ESL0693]|nr:hypothetical protein [Neisseriaceae bacterium ESL0693]
MGYKLPHDVTCHQTKANAEQAFIASFPTMIDQNGYVQSLTRSDNHLEFNNQQITLQLQSCDYEQAQINNLVHKSEFISAIGMTFLFLAALFWLLNKII